jgi:hypothetical protein
MRLQTKTVTAAAVRARTEVEIEAASIILPFLLIEITPYLRLEKSFNK